jgi:uncharacterized protein (TIGR02588 family)
VSDNDETTDQAQSEGGSSAGEYVLGGVGAVLVVALIAFLTYQALIRDSGPEISVEVTQVQAVDAGYAVRVQVHNDGGTTASGVVVSGQLTRQGRQVDQASTTVSYVPPDSMRTAALVFSEDPRNGQLTVGPDGYAVS